MFWQFGKIPEIQFFLTTSKIHNQEQLDYNLYSTCFESYNFYNKFGFGGGGGLGNDQ